MSGDRRDDDLRPDAATDLADVSADTEEPDALPGGSPEDEASGDDAAPGDPVLALEQERDEALAQSASHLDDLRRLKAEFENYRKRMVKEQTHVIERAAEALIERLLPVLDDFELALLAADRTQDYESMVRGVEMVYGKLVEELRREGLERIESLHKPFDPELHEAVMRAEGEADELFVVDEMRSGYTLRGRVVRPAMVKVGPKR